MKRIILSFLLFSLSLYGCEVLGIGTPCMDLLIKVDDDFLASVGAEKGGSKYDDWESLNSVLKKANQEPHFTAGGSTSNTIKGLANLDHQCAMFGMMGRDESGKRYLENISPLRIEPRFIFSDTPSQQVVALLTPDHQRSFRVYLGAATELHAKHLSPDLFKGVRLVHIEGYALYNGDLVEKAMQMAKKAGALVSFDMGSYNVVRSHKEQIIHLLRYVDIVFANEDEAYELTGLSPEESCEKLRHMCPTTVILLGPRGCLAANQKEMIEYPAITVEVIDTTGAGDLFASGFLHGCLKGMSLSDCCLCGNLTASAVISVIGAEVSKENWTLLKTVMPDASAFPFMDGMDGMDRMDKDKMHF